MSRTSIKARFDNVLASDPKKLAQSKGLTVSVILRVRQPTKRS